MLRGELVVDISKCDKNGKKSFTNKENSKKKVLPLTQFLTTRKKYVWHIILENPQQTMVRKDEDPLRTNT